MPYHYTATKTEAATIRTAYEVIERVLASSTSSDRLLADCHKIERANDRGSSFVASSLLERQARFVTYFRNGIGADKYRIANLYGIKETALRLLIAGAHYSGSGKLSADDIVAICHAANAHTDIVGRAIAVAA